MKESKYIVDPLKLGLSLATIIVTITLAITLSYIARYGSALIFALLSLPFFYTTAIYGRRVIINDESVSSFFLSKKLKEMKWSDIKEIGIVGSKPFDKNEKGKKGTLYLYISLETMTDDERFNMMVSWPPKDKLFLTFDKDRANALQLRFNSKLIKYNAGQVELS